MAYEIARVFEKRATEKSTWSGRIGKVELFVSDDGIWSIDGKVLGRKSVEYLLNFSLQSLQDAYAGADDLTEATANWAKKRDALIEGTIGQRAANGLGAFERIGHAMIKAAMLEKDAKRFDGMDDDAVAELVAEKFEANRAALTPAIDAEIERREEAKRAKAKVAEKIGTLDL